MLTDDARLGLAVTGGSLDTLLYESPMQPSETEMGLAINAGELFEVQPPKFQDAIEQGLTVTGGQLLTPLPQHTYDATNLGLSVSGGIVATPPIGTFDADEANTTLTITGGALYVP
ncbi:MAG: hypothetical protein ACREP4_06640 [Stenotrophomonas sp.]